ncbi:AIPR family protein [Planomonospora sp. ID82291]|uniref:AIPR family protein n=1 Tax=Planomonospora sp. ID82291 TaxID=2738136 RepID=UPI0018C42799|nr:AIPR family protein [Planomonospora sp. ID82291]MBG0816059.1 AIPR family protein [Planomonospora sp. ID82291]
MGKQSGMPLRVHQIAEALHREFDDLISMSDALRTGPEEFERKFLSRALAAFVARKLTGCDSAAAAGTLIDGRNDLGVDGVAFTDGGLHLLLIQSKWSDKGTAGFGVAEALKFVQGLRIIDQQRFGRFNDQFQRHAEQVKAVLKDPRGRITLVTVLVGDGTLSNEVLDCFHDVQREFNTDYDRKLGYEVWSAQRVWEAVRDDLAEPPISLTAPMDKWIPLADPYEAYQGRVPAAEIAQWYEEHGDRLFSQNIRRSLGLTEVNHGLVETLTENPEDFWYLNNGITILCDHAERQAWSRASQAPVRLRMHGASVVNGAQTVTATAEAMRRAADMASQAYVGVKVITTRHCPDGFGTTVTRTTNTQNQVERRDIVVALDPVQSAVREDFALSLDKSYTFRRGELDPLPDAGCSVVHAATALACAHRNPDLAVRAKRSTDLLWETGPSGAYTLLFDPAPNAYQIWHSVLIMRAVGAALEESKGQREGRARAVAENADLLLTHIIFQRIGTEDIDSSTYDLDAARERIPGLVIEGLTWLIHHLDAEFGPTSFISSTFANPDRCRTLVRRVLSELGGGKTAPDLPTEYQPPARGRRTRRPNAVPTLVDAGRLADGTPLTFAYATQNEHDALSAWLTADPRRGQAAWTNNRSKPLVWAVDGNRYSPTGLVTHIWDEAGWDPETRPVAVQGPSRWTVPGEGTIWQLALEVLAQRDEELDNAADRQASRDATMADDLLALASKVRSRLEPTEPSTAPLDDPEAGLLK